jgi:cbb3-type cytochrome oxidase subunit 3
MGLTPLSLIEFLPLILVIVLTFVVLAVWAKLFGKKEKIETTDPYNKRAC